MAYSIMPGNTISNPTGLSCLASAAAHWFFSTKLRA
uniref:Uncharacterized protein n=1 Tax=Rhizophora mucronata TaxID=61149 RepID=A0A2P2PTD9_RHIMU